MHILYAHEAVEVHLLEDLTPESLKGSRKGAIPVYCEGKDTVKAVPIQDLKLNVTPYDVRGWCQAEMEWARLRASVKGASVPRPPQIFKKAISLLQFTHRSDLDAVVQLQEKAGATKFSVIY